MFYYICLKILSIILQSEYFTLNSDLTKYSGSTPLHRRVQLSLRTVVRVFYVRSSFGHLAPSLATMATASAAGLALRRHVIPLVSLFNDQADNTKVSLMRSVNIGDGNNEKRKYNVPYASSQDVETLCRCVLEFDDVAAVAPLSLTTGPLKFSYFRQCLGGTIRDKWDVLADGRNETVANFQLVCNELIAELVCPTDLADQRHYLETSKKPYKMNCAAFSARLETINKMMSLFPGAGGNPPMQAVDIKNLYYQMMPSEWQRAFLSSGQVITDPTYTLLSLQRFMTLQEEQNQADVARRRQLQQRNPRSRGGRGGRSLNRRGAAGRTGQPSTPIIELPGPFLQPLLALHHLREETLYPFVDLFVHQTKANVLTVEANLTIRTRAHQG